MSVTVRPARPADADAVAALARELNTRMGDPVEHFTAERVAADAFGPEPAFELLVAEDGDGALVGYALFVDAYETGWAARGLYVQDLYVSERTRRRGIGRKLVAALAAEARARGKTYLGWVSKAWNTEAQAFYRSLGAIEEPVVAHALTFAAFERLADEHEATAGNDGRL